jgi:hypothetical protein
MPLLGQDFRNGPPFAVLIRDLRVTGKLGLTVWNAAIAV